jgi:hypothetical protein
LFVERFLNPEKRIIVVVSRANGVLPEH